MKHIRKSVFFLAVVMALLGLASKSGAVTNGVKYGAHNIGTTGQGNFGGGVTGTAETEICIFCHTPHNAQAGKKFLWNRNAPVTASFTLYTGSPTLNFKGATYGTLSEVSKMCMSCHDGVTALNSMANPKWMDPNMDQIGDIQSADPWGSNIGEWSVTNPTGGGNLTNDHPVSFSYAASISGGDGTLKPLDGGNKSVGGLPLWDDGTGTYKVECVTCHDPHINYGYWSWSQQIPNGGGDTTLAPFLRRSNESSGLCFTCHNK